MLNGNLKISTIKIEFFNINRYEGMDEPLEILLQSLYRRLT